MPKTSRRSEGVNMPVFKKKNPEAEKDPEKKTPAPKRERTPRKQKEKSENIFNPNLFFKNVTKAPAEPKAILEAKRLPDNLTRFEPQIDQGLNDDQVNSRKEEGYTNLSKDNTTKSIWKILKENIFTYFNMLLLAIAILLIVFGQYTQITFLVMAIANTVIGIIQGIKARNTLMKLKLVTTSIVEVIRNGVRVPLNTEELVLDDVYIIKNGDQIPTDSILLSGKLEVNESLLTGESLPIQKEVGDKIFAGSFVVSGSATVKASLVGEYNYIAGIQAKAKELTKPKSELVRSLNAVIKIIGILIIPLGGLMFWSQWSAAAKVLPIDTDPFLIAQQAIKATAGSMIGMIPSGMYLLTSVALASSVIALGKQHAMVQDLYSVEMLARVNTLCLDKTGTLTDGTMRVDDVLILDGSYDLHALIGSYLNAFTESNQTSVALTAKYPLRNDYKVLANIPFSSTRKHSAVEFEKLGTFLIGAPEYLIKTKDKGLTTYITDKESAGYRVIAFCRNDGEIRQGEVTGKNTPIALFTLEDHIRDEAPDTITWFVENGVEIKIISGDNPLTVSEIAKKCAVPQSEKCISLEGLSNPDIANIIKDYTIFGRVSPEQKAFIIAELKRQGRTVGMTGDGVNDILAMKNADCSVAMANGSSAARNTANLVLLDSNFSSMPAAVKEGRRAVNNVQRSSALYLMKTIFTMVFTMIVLITSMGAAIPYPFDPNNLLVTEMCCIGFVSIVLALQKNDELIRGSFLKNTFARAVPAAICLIFAISINYILYYIPGNFLGFPEEAVDKLLSFKTLNSLSMVAVSLGMSYHCFDIKIPFKDSKNAFKLSMFCLTVLFVLIMVFAFPYLPPIIGQGSGSNLSLQLLGIDFRYISQTMWFLLVIYVFGFYTLLRVLIACLQSLFIKQEDIKADLLPPIETESK